jgi:hypothetical protein
MARTPLAAFFNIPTKGSPCGMSQVSRARFMSDWVDLREHVAQPTLRLGPVKIGPSWPEDGMRKWEVIVSRAVR